MRYPPEHKAETIRKIVKEAGSLAKKEGFGTTGIDSLTKAAGLTTGAFYKHFSGKDELLGAMIDYELKRTEGLFAGTGKSAPTTLVDIASVYLTQAHLAHPEKGCMLPSLAPEVARAGTETRQKYDAGLKRVHQSMQAVCGADNAWAMLAMAVGAVSLARASADPAVQKNILEACMRQTRAMDQSDRQTKVKGAEDGAAE